MTSAASHSRPLTGCGGCLPGSESTVTTPAATVRW